MRLDLWNQLSITEKTTLELRFDGPISEQAVRDVIRLREPRTPETLRKMIDQLLIDVQWHNAEGKRYAKEGDTWMANHHNRKARDKLAQVDELDAERALKLGEAPAMQAAAE